MKAVKRLCLILGIIGLTASVYMLICGGICLAGKNWAQSYYVQDSGGRYTATDIKVNELSPGYYTAWDFRIEKDSRAVVIRPDAIDILIPSENGETAPISSFMVDAESGNPENPAFIGTAAEVEMSDYLDGAGREEITKLKLFPFKAEYLHNSGSSTLTEPALREFWVESSNGTGYRSLRWRLNPEKHYLVIMNEDGSAGIDVNLKIKAGMPLLVTFGSGHIFSGGIILLTSGLMISFSGRTRNSVYPEPLQYLLQKEKSR